MKYLLLIFRSRNEALATYEFLASRGVSCTTLNAPRSLVKSCGLALKTLADENTLLSHLRQCRVFSEVKVYRAEASFGGTSYRRII